jgi:hypothetical protein
MYRILFLFRVWFSLNWLKFFRLYDTHSDNIVWLLPTFPNLKDIVSYLGSYSEHLNDAALINGLLAANQPFRIVLGKKTGKLHRKNIFYTITPRFNIYGFHNYSTAMTAVIHQLEQQGNNLFPCEYEAKWWENKAFMHQKFSELGISQPETRIIRAESEVNYSTIKYPILLKEVHSCSSIGVHKAKDEKELRRLVKAQYDKGATTFLLQKLIDMRRDLRVIFVGDEIILHYWRINKGEDWRPTSTGHGSTVDFVTFPEQWRGFITEQFQRLNLRTGAFDIAWEGDDLSTKPLMLEISPAYQPNPKPAEAMKHLPYADYKKKYIGKGNYHTAYIDIVFYIKSRLVQSYFASNAIKTSEIVLETQPLELENATLMA